VPDRAMIDSAVSSVRTKSTSVANYLKARGVTAEELPPDLLRELTRLVDNGQLSATPSAPLLPPASSDPDAGDRRDLLSFEMYLTAWIASARVCDRPKDRAA
jgi:hypothetical protein